MQDVKDRDPNPPDLSEDTRKVWVNLSSDDAFDMAMDYVNELHKRDKQQLFPTQIAYQLLFDAITESSRRSQADFIGKAFCEANSEEWRYD